jgi:hypothetical protein
MRRERPITGACVRIEHKLHAHCRRCRSSLPSEASSLPSLHAAMSCLLPSPKHSSPLSFSLHSHACSLLAHDPQKYNLPPFRRCGAQTVAAVRAFLEKLLHYLSSQLTSFWATKCANAAALDPWPNTAKALRSVVQETTHR